MFNFFVLIMKNNVFSFLYIQRGFVYAQPFINFL